MAKIGLVYISDESQISMGLAYISAVLKQGGHSVVLWDDYYIKEKGIVNEIIKSDAQIVMFSVHTLAYQRILEMSKQVKSKRPDIIILFGGWHSVIDPEGMINEPSIDLVCVGEGEYAALDVANDFDKTGLKNADKIANIWSKKDGIITRNPSRKLGSLDDLPFPDRDIFNKSSLIDRDGRFYFSTGRGCPHNCTYCCNKKMVDLYKSCDSPYVRLRSINKCMEEFRTIKEKYNPPQIIFTDEQFLISENRTKEFCKVYIENNIKIPFSFMARVEKITDEVAKALKEAGCTRIFFGIESGNDELRRKYLNRYMTNEQIINAFDICRKHGIETCSFNMIGLPFETKKTIRDTFELNKRCNPDLFQISIVYPFPATEMRDIYKKYDMIDESKDKGRNIFNTYILKNTEVSFSYIKHQQIFMQLYFSHYKILSHISKIIPANLLNQYVIFAQFLRKKKKTKLVLYKITKLLGSFS
ncbi:MAG: B12-binding domain-containing radical SAM protein [Nanoarchaeota archaeon]|nr:B12-binding domain-containing radical SAM protein [Nanoarchaeota archaeon]MBU4124412.1 B12-binding domain-containing radical SAM protein [Nanoarchaeota archaeon]